MTSMSSYCSQPRECVRVPSMLFAIRRFAPQCRRCDHHSSIVITIPRLRSHSCELICNAGIVITIRQVWSKPPDGDRYLTALAHNPKVANSPRGSKTQSGNCGQCRRIVSAHAALSLEPRRFNRNMETGTAIRKLGPKLTGRDYKPRTLDTTAGLRSQSANVHSKFANNIGGFQT
jgi:hypothetical protein